MHSGAQKNPILCWCCSWAEFAVVWVSRYHPFIARIHTAAVTPAGTRLLGQLSHSVSQALLATSCRLCSSVAKAQHTIRGEHIAKHSACLQSAVACYGMFECARQAQLRPGCKGGGSRGDGGVDLGTIALHGVREVHVVLQHLKHITACIANRNPEGISTMLKVLYNTQTSPGTLIKRYLDFFTTRHEHGVYKQVSKAPFFDLLRC